MPGWLIRGATIVDARGERSGDVLVRDDRIVEVGNVHTATDESVLAANGQYVTPGLIDCHVHLCHQAGPDPRVIIGKTDVRLGTEAADAARKTVRAGVTTARDCGGRGFVETYLRDAIRAGAAEGPRLLTSGHPIVRRGGHMSYYGREVDGPEDARRAAVEQVMRGVDWLKVAATGGVTTPNVDPRKAELTEAEIRAVVEEGAKSRRPVAAHAHGGDGIRNALAAGVRSVEHGTFADDDMIRYMVQHDVFLVPTLVATRAMIDAGTAKGVPSYAVQKAEEIDTVRRKTFSDCVRHGVKIAMGTDAGTPFNPHGENAREIELMVEAGMTTAQGLEASTVTAAKLLGLEGDVGLVERGFVADLLVLSNNPLDDPRAFRRGLGIVIRAGRVVRE